MTARHACHVQVDYHTGRDWRRATAMDVSQRGCRLRLGENLDRGASVNVRFMHAADDGQVFAAQLDGIVIWSRIEGLSHQAGIHFPGAVSELLEIIASLK